jgi:hypothetical protein
LPSHSSIHSNIYASTAAEFHNIGNRVFSSKSLPRRSLTFRHLILSFLLSVAHCTLSILTRLLTTILLVEKSSYLGSPLVDETMALVDHLPRIKTLLHGAQALFILVAACITIGYFVQRSFNGASINWYFALVS